MAERPPPHDLAHCRNVETLGVDLAVVVHQPPRQLVVGFSTQAHRLVVQPSKLARRLPTARSRGHVRGRDRSLEVTHQNELAHLVGWNRKLALAVPAVRSLWVDALG